MKAIVTVDVDIKHARTALIIAGYVVDNKTDEEICKMAIKMNDCYAVETETINLDEESLDTAAKTTEQTTWIPCKERSPKKSGKYWCTFGGTNLTGVDYYTTESDAKELFVDPEEWIGWQSHNVIAWMSLPESYKAESEGE